MRQVSRSLQKDILAATYGTQEHVEAPELEPDGLPQPIALIQQALATQAFGPALIRNVVNEAALGPIAERNQEQNPRAIPRHRLRHAVTYFGLFAGTSAFTSAVAATSAATGAALLNASGYAGYVVKEAAGAAATGGALFTVHALFLRTIIKRTLEDNSISANFALLVTDAAITTALSLIGHAISYPTDSSMSTANTAAASAVGSAFTGGVIQLFSYIYHNRYQLFYLPFYRHQERADARPEADARVMPI